MSELLEFYGNDTDEMQSQAALQWVRDLKDEHHRVAMALLPNVDRNGRPYRWINCTDKHGEKSGPSIALYISSGLADSHEGQMEIITEVTPADFNGMRIYWYDRSDDYWAVYLGKPSNEDVVML